MPDYVRNLFAGIVLVQEAYRVAIATSATFVSLFSVSGYTLVARDKIGRGAGLRS